MRHKNDAIRHVFLEHSTEFVRKTDTTKLRKNQLAANQRRRSRKVEYFMGLSLKAYSTSPSFCAEFVV